MSRIILDLDTYKTYPNALTIYTDAELKILLEIQNEYVLDWLRFPDTETFEDKFTSIAPIQKAVFDLVNLNVESTDNQGIKSQTLEGNNVQFDSFEKRQSMILSRIARYKAHTEVTSVL